MYDNLQAEIKFRCKYFRLKMVVQPYENGCDERLRRLHQSELTWSGWDADSITESALELCSPGAPPFRTALKLLPDCGVWGKLWNTNTDPLKQSNSKGINKINTNLKAQIRTMFMYMCTDLSAAKTDSRFKLHYDRRSVGQSVLVSGTHLGPATLSPLLSLIIFRQLRIYWCGRPLWREVGSVVVIFLFCCTSLYLDSPNLEGRVPVFISLRNRVAQLYPRALGLLRLSTLLCDWWLVSQYVLVSGTPSGPKIRFYFSVYFARIALLFVLGALSDERTGL
jgi:hypothetical protein